MFNSIITSIFADIFTKNILILQKGPNISPLNSWINLTVH